MDDFSKAPVSISEVRPARDHDMRSRTPRDVLVSLLRDIDSGTASISAMDKASQLLRAGLNAQGDADAGRLDRLRQE